MHFIIIPGLDGSDDNHSAIALGIRLAARRHPDRARVLRTHPS